MKKRIVPAALAVLMAASTVTPARAVYSNYNNMDAETDRVVIAQGENQGNHFTGKGTVDKTTDTRTQEQREDDSNAARIDELTQLSAGLEEQIRNGGGGGSIVYPGQGGGGGPEFPGGGGLNPGGGGGGGTNPGGGGGRVFFLTPGWRSPSLAAGFLWHCCSIFGTETVSTSCQST